MSKRKSFSSYLSIQSFNPLNSQRWELCRARYVLHVVDHHFMYHRGIKLKGTKSFKKAKQVSQLRLIIFQLGRNFSVNFLEYNQLQIVLYVGTKYIQNRVHIGNTKKPCPTTVKRYWEYMIVPRDYIKNNHMIIKHVQIRKY